MATGKGRSTWKWRSAISFSLLFAGLVLVVSGVALYVAPAGRVAHTVDWQVLGLDKWQWEALHNVFGYLVIGFGAIHLALNWRVLLNYLRNRTTRAYRLRAELIIALLVTVLVGIGTLKGWPPFDTVTNVSEPTGRAWEVGIQGVPADGDYGGRGGGGWRGGRSN